MKSKKIVIIFVIVLMLMLIPIPLKLKDGGSTEYKAMLYSVPPIIETINTTFETYYKMSDGTWQCNGNSYKHRLEITGRMSSAAKSTTFVYLSNIENISFDRACLAAGLSSSTTDYFSVEEAVLIDCFNVE